MSYIALYRKYRPLKFSEVVGQDHIVKVLKNQISNNKIGHAYLFSGGRGSGKTSTAKILARAVNCPNLKDGEPCNECEVCKEAISGNLSDIIEMDAASNNGVDNIRDIREEVEFVPTVGKYRVYIIDEVHMLSTGAFNALLKTLEEPPAHVIFILATTEPQKLPETILSRCLRFDFGRIHEEDIIKRLKFICDDSNIKIEEGALRLIARMADGAMRDGISILDRCGQEGDEVITEERIRGFLGVPKFDSLFDITEALISKNIDRVLLLSNQIIQDGKNVRVFLNELIKFERDIALISLNASYAGYSEEEKSKIMNLINASSRSAFLDLITNLSDIDNNIRWASNPEILFETGLIKLCDKKEARAVANAESDLKDKVLTIIKENGKIRLHADLLLAKFELQDDGIVHIIFNGNLQSVTKDNLSKDESKVVIKSAVKAALGKETSVKYDNFR